MRAVFAGDGDFIARRAPQRTADTGWRVDLQAKTASHSCGLLFEFVALTARSSCSGASPAGRLTLDTCGSVDGRGAWAIVAPPAALERALYHLESRCPGAGVRHVCELTRQAGLAWTRACRESTGVRGSTRPGAPHLHSTAKPAPAGRQLRQTLELQLQEP